MAEIARLRNPEVVVRDTVKELILKAYVTDPVMGAVKEEPLLATFQLWAKDADTGVFVGAEKGKLAALAVVHINTGPMAPQPSVSQFYNEGSAGLRKALMKTVVEYIVENGYASFLALNCTGKDDEAWSKLFALAGKTEKVGTLMKFTVE